MDATNIIDIDEQRRRLSDALNPHDANGSCHALGVVEDRLNAGDLRMNGIETMLKQNCSDTAEVLDILRLGKSFFRVIGIFGNLVKWGAAIAAPLLVLIYTIKSGGKP